MTSAWTENGPVSLPPRSLVYGAGALLCVLALVGVGMGLRAAWKQTGLPELSGEASTGGDADTLIAKPIVELPAPPTNAAAADASAEAANKTTADELAQKTAEAQAIQAKASKPGRDIDQILASPTEKPTAPTKPPADEAPPAPPVKSDVPF